MGLTFLFHRPFRVGRATFRPEQALSGQPDLKTESITRVWHVGEALIYKGESFGKSRLVGSSVYPTNADVNKIYGEKMATQEDLRAVAGKAVADPEFRQKLIEDPESAVKVAGIELSAEQMDALKNLDKEQLEKGLADLDERLTMHCWGKGWVCNWN
jgi:hypothetical protein